MSDNSLMTGPGKALLRNILAMEPVGALYSYVVDGATCRCNQGKNIIFSNCAEVAETPPPGRLVLPEAYSHDVTIKGKPVLNCADNNAKVNFKDMPDCLITGQSCEESRSFPELWLNVLKNTMIKGYPALLNISKIVCYCEGSERGIISILDDGQAKGV